MQIWHDKCAVCLDILIARLSVIFSYSLQSPYTILNEICLDKYLTKND